jgi:hypothetical protein
MAKRQMRAQGRQAGGKREDDSSERLKYMESQLAKKKNYVPYEKHLEIERRRVMEQKNKADSVDWVIPFIILAAIAGGIGALLYFGGFLTP